MGVHTTREIVGASLEPSTRSSGAVTTGLCSAPFSPRSPASLRTVVSRSTLREDQLVIKRVVAGAVDREAAVFHGQLLVRAAAVVVQHVDRGDGPPAKLDRRLHRLQQDRGLAVVEILWSTAKYLKPVLQLRATAERMARFAPASVAPLSAAVSTIEA